MTIQPQTDQDLLREQVRARYAAAAIKVTSGHGDCGCGQPAVCGCDRGGCGGAATAEGRAWGRVVRRLDRDQLPDSALLASLGCGNPTAVAELHEGETVLDLGSGGGIDLLVSARRVGSLGQGLWAGQDRGAVGPGPDNAAEAGATTSRFEGARSRPSRCRPRPSMW